MRRGKKTRRALAIATCLALLLCLAQGAQAKNDPLGSGKTKLSLDKSFLSFLSQNNLKLRAKLGAKRRGKTITLPITGGTMDLAEGRGEVQQEGTLFFEGAKGKVPFREITIKTKRTPLVAKVGGSQLKVAQAKRISSTRAGFGSTFKATELSLTAKAATRLNKKLRPKVSFAQGQLLGSLVSSPQPKLITIEDQGRATLAFDAAFVQKLEGRFVSLNPVFPAEHQGTTFTFPIAAGGALAPDGSQGTLRTAGDVELLQLHGAQLFWREIWFDLGAHQGNTEAELDPSPPYPGKSPRGALFDLAATAVASDPKTRTISVSGAPLTLNAAGAQELNEAFGEGKGLFAVGELVGAVSFSAVGE
jgi:hypothetical protein